MRACRYRAPELLLTCSEYGYEVDVWSGALRTDPQTPLGPTPNPTRCGSADPARPSPGWKSVGRSAAARRGRRVRYEWYLSARKRAAARIE